MGETLSRIVNQPSGVLSQSQNKAKPKTAEESRVSEAHGVNTNTTNSEATRAQNDEITGIDNEATEHDVSTAAESIDPNSESQLHTVKEGDAEEFDEMMEQLLDRRELDGSQNMETDDTINDSQMIGHQESFVEDEAGGDDDSETDSSHSQESSQAEDEELDDNDDEDEGDDDEDDEDDDD